MRMLTQTSWMRHHTPCENIITFESNWCRLHSPGLVWQGFLPAPAQMGRLAISWSLLVVGMRSILSDRQVSCHLLIGVALCHGRPEGVEGKLAGRVFQCTACPHVAPSG